MQNIDEKLLISRAEDTVMLAEKHCCLKIFGFLTPYERAVIEKSIISPQDIICKFCGGYSYSERTLFIAFPNFVSEYEKDIPISVIEITGRDIMGLSHRDYLGAILGLGIKRDKIGDIIVFDDKCFVFVLEDIAEYIINNLTKIGRKGIKTKIKCVSEVEIPEPNYEVINGTVPSLRLDAIVALALNVSRSTANNLILNEKVFINWRPEKRNDFILANDAILSVRGYGRFKIIISDKFSRKNRQHITVEKFL